MARLFRVNISAEIEAEDPDAAAAFFRATLPGIPDIPTLYDVFELTIDPLWVQGSRSHKIQQGGPVSTKGILS